MIRTAAVLLGLLTAWPGPVRAADPTPAQAEFFEKKVRPILADKCLSCHSAAAKKTKGGLALDSRDAAVRGGETGPGLVPGKPAESLLIKAVRYDELEMPPSGKLPADEVAALTKWVEMGAPWPGATTPAGPTHGDGKTADAGKSHWAWQPLRPVTPPAVKNAAWPANPIDRFVLSKLEANNLTPSPPADRRTLIRRVYLDLVGLPPTPDEVDAFLKDTSADAYAKMIDKLLASPHYGERWGRHWLDVARYSDGLGGFLDAAPLPEAWRYRDWVVAALNADLPYDRFVKDQIAGDRTGDPQAVAATGLLAVGPTYISDGGDPESTAKAKAETLDDRVDTVTRGFLALTVSCARCHDHKFDPIPQADYYSLAGVFNNTRTLDVPAGPAADAQKTDDHAKALTAAEARLKAWQTAADDDASQALMRDAARTLDALVRFHHQPKATDLAAFARKEKLHPFALQAWSDAAQHRDAATTFPDLAAWLRLKPLDTGSDAEKLAEQAQAFQDRIDAVLDKLSLGSGPTYKRLRGLPPADYQLYLALRTGPCKPRSDVQLSDASRKQKAELEAEVKRLKDTAPPPVPKFHAAADAGAADMAVAIRGDLRKPGPVVPRRFLSVLSDEKRTNWTSGSGRVQLADAITNPKNPLTPRVIVNRVWQHHFGQGLVRTPSNFGLLGEKPTHPELLDWLANHLVASGWSLKALHRTILLSATYRMDSKFDAAGFRADGDNRLQWRMAPRRLDVEAWRDSVLAVSGELDRTMGGPPVKDILASPRRTLYAAVSRNGDRLPSDEFLRLFDFPSARATASERTASTVPQQYLFLMNSPFMAVRAKAFADRLARDADTDAGRIDRAYALLYARSPTAEERELGLAFLAAGSDDAPRWPQYAQVLLSSHEFMEAR